MATLKGTLAFLYIVINTAFWCIPIYLLAIPRFTLPTRDLRAFFGDLMSRAADGWVACNRLMLQALRIVAIERSFRTDEPLARQRWYIVVSNHQSWSDILILQDTFLGRIPPLKFFNKRPLLWVPLLGFAMWLLDFPYVRRYSREAIAANPSLRLHDQVTTAKACETFKARPTSVLAFLEGTRFTEAKHRVQQAPYQHLLAPKIGGFCYVGANLSAQIHRVLDVTIFYPNGAPTFWDFLCGRCERARIETSTRPLPPDLLSLDAQAEIPPSTRDNLHKWVDELWQQKDARLQELLSLR